MRPYTSGLGKSFLIVAVSIVRWVTTRTGG